MSGTVKNIYVAMLSEELQEDVGTPTRLRYAKEWLHIMKNSERFLKAARWTKG